MKTILITGANRGIGLVFCRKYAEEGCLVLACCLHPDKTDALKQLAAQYPEPLHIHALDVADHAQIEHLAQTLANASTTLACIRPPSSGFGNRV